MLRPQVLLVLACLPLNAGCLVCYDRIDIVRREEEAQQVAFESEAAERLFADSLEKRRETSGQEESSQDLTIPLLLAWRKSQKRSDAAFFNDQVKTCDRDGNRFLSDTEVAAYHKLVTGKDDPLGAYTRVLEQHGDLKISAAKKVYDVPFDQAFVSPPELTLSHEAVRCARVEPSETGFRITFKEAPAPCTVHWYARGRPWVNHGAIKFGILTVPEKDDEEDMPTFALPPAAQASGLNTALQALGCAK